MVGGMKYHKGRWWKTKGASRTPTSVPEMQVMFLNVNGVHRPSKRNNLLAMQMQHGWGVVMLADTRVVDTRDLIPLNKLWKCKDGFWSKGTPNVGGTAILFYKQVLIKSTHQDPGGRYTRVDLVWEGETFTLLCVYAPANHTERKAFFADTLLPYLQTNPPAERFVVGGDFNFVENPSLDRTSLNAGGIAGLTEWAELAESVGLLDAFRKFHPRKKTYTFLSAAHRMQTRIDRVYCSENGLPNVKSCDHVPIPSVISDHLAGVVVTLRAISSATRGPSFWKLNASLICKPGFQKLVKSTIADFVSSKDRYPSIQTWWDMLKFAIQFRIKDYSKQQAFQRSRAICLLEKEAAQVNDELAAQPSDSSLHLRRARLDHILADYYADIHEAARMKAGMKYKTQGERPTKYFTSLVRQRAEKSQMTSLKVSRNGVDMVIDSVEDILEEASNFYAELYSRRVPPSEQASAASFLTGCVHTKLSDTDRAFCENPLTDEELFDALKKLPKGKVPRIDGLPVEIFKAFWDDLKDSFLALMQSSFSLQTLPETMRTSIITLIYKKKSRDDIRNYRPISLLCSDYKIVAKALAQRMKSVLPSIIHKDQTGFLKNRYIGENITLFLDTQEHLCKTQKRGYAFLADWEKAYDRIDRGFLEQSLAAFGFGPTFCQWFRLLHKNSTAQVIVNGFLTDSFSVDSGVRQGCPWAPFLFLIGVEPLACALRQRNDIQGIVLPGGEKILYSGYADDTPFSFQTLKT